VNHQGFLDLSPTAMAEFNRQVPVPTDVPVFSIAGDPDPLDVCWPLRRLHAALGELEGPNDGLVSVESATAIGQMLPSWPVDHLRQMNWLATRPAPTVSHPPYPVVAMYYANILANLAEAGFAAPTEPMLASRESA